MFEEANDSLIVHFEVPCGQSEIIWLEFKELNEVIVINYFFLN